MHLILTGATGLVGSGVLDAMLKTKQVSKITILSRRAVRMADDAKDPRVQVILHQDFEKYDASLLSQIKDANGCVWALGISQNQVGKEDYIKITKTFPLRFAEAFQQARSSTTATTEPFHFVYVSGEGATHSPGMLTPIFGRVKGETELALAQMHNPKSFNAVTLRPAFVDCSAHEAIKPYVPAVSSLRSGMSTVLGPVVRAAIQGSWSPTEPLGKFLTEMAMGRWKDASGPGVQDFGGSKVLGNAAFVRLAGVGRS